MMETIGAAKASPSKEFFVNMLTRDIELEDAVLDLLDNCVDGILRSKPKLSDEKPYADFWAKITFCKDYFKIEDNCGGIPKDVAKKYAFSMGRQSASKLDSSGATIGMYGIGMKRAIFKMGRDATVSSHHDLDAYSVKFTSDWMSDDKWSDLPMYALEKGELKQKGTVIEVHQLMADVAPHFSDDRWIERFRTIVSQHYAFIISKGFSITVDNGEKTNASNEPIKAESFSLLSSKYINEQEKLEPYIYTGELKGVKIEIYAGFYRELLSQKELDEQEEMPGDSSNAGWTIACNDRVVVWKDKTRLTGWGEASVPSYHTQFIAITGLVLLSSKDPKKLPLTTTKRGIDASREIYSEVKDLMREATKSLASFTNRWKKFPDKRNEIYRSSETLDLPSLQVRKSDLDSSKQMASMRKVEGVKRYTPKLPEPKQEKTSARVSFVAEKKDIKKISSDLFDDRNVKPSVVGEAVFNRYLEELK